MTSRIHAAIHLLAVVAECDRPLSSQFLAARVGTDPSWIRELLGFLSRADITHVTSGPWRGTVLCRPPGSITLGAVYRAIDGDKPLRVGSTSLPRRTPHDLQIAEDVDRIVQRALVSATAAMVQDLDAVTIADIAANARERRRARAV